MRTLLLALLVTTFLPGGPAGEADGSTGSPTFTRHSAPYGLANVGDAGEPTLGVNWRTDAVMFQSGASTYRVLFDDLSTPPVAVWQDRTAASSIVNVDPLLFVDSATGRTFAGGLDGACSVLSISDNDGFTWSPVGNSCAGADHPTIGSGPWTANRPLAAIHARAVYYCAQSSVVTCATSMDGGVTFGPGVTVTCSFLNPGLHGSVHIGPNGWVYLPFRTCGDVNGLGVSKDNGLTWSARPIPRAEAPDLGFDPDVATTTSGWAYVAYPTAEYGVGAALTKDGGLTWTDFGEVAARAGVMSATFLEMVAGDDDRAAIIHFGSDTNGSPHEVGFAGDWRIYITYTSDAGSSWTTVRASENIAHRGWICSDGTQCLSGRNLLDFIDAQLDARGHILVAYADGCTAACEMGYAPSIAAHATILRQSGGAGLFRAFDAGVAPEEADIPDDQIEAVSDALDDALNPDDG